MSLLGRLLARGGPDVEKDVASAVNLFERAINIPSELFIKKILYKNF